MVRWLAGAAAVLAAVAVVVTLGGRRTGPEIVVNAPVTPEPAPPVPDRPAAPALLPAVVTVADIDPLLDPPAIPPADVAPAGPVLTAVGFEEPAAPAPAAPNPPPIPPAAGDDDAPPVSLGGPLPVDRVRAGWYGDRWGTLVGPVADYWVERAPVPTGVGDDGRHPGTPEFPGVRHKITVGVGLYF